jgi:hypothetical protein
MGSSKGQKSFSLIKYNIQWHLISAFIEEILEKRLLAVAVGEEPNFHQEKITHTERNQVALHHGFISVNPVRTLHFSTTIQEVKDEPKEQPKKRVFRQ